MSVRSFKKSLGAFSLGMMNVAIVASLQMMMPCAVYGSSLIFFYLLAVLTFFIPSLFIIAELTTASPVTGGAYIWVERAFGKNWGFFTVCIQWLCNLIWYPTIFSLIAVSLAYLIAPDLAHNKIYLFSCMLILFWGITFLNCLGITVSSLFSGICALVGVLLPTLILIVCGVFWLLSSQVTQIEFNLSAIFPKFKDPSQYAFLSQVVISLIGLEMAFVHAGDVKKPEQNIPRALFFSAIMILFIVISAPLSIATVIPSQEIGVVSGLFDAFRIFFSNFHLPSYVFPLTLSLILLGNCGNIAAWMISATRGMHIASLKCNMPSFFKATNRFMAPVGILVIEAIIFSIGALFSFILIRSAMRIGYLLALACQIALIYYLVIFAAAVKLKKERRLIENAYAIPGGCKGTTFAAILASLAVLVAIVSNFFPPNQGGVSQGENYPFILLAGILFILALPFVLLALKKRI